MKSEEADHQKAVIEWAAWHEKKWPCLKFLYACPNEGMHKVQYRVHQKAMGVKSGVPDLFLPFPAPNPKCHPGQQRKYCNGLYIEMKAGKNNPTKNQQDWHDYLREVGYRVEVCWSCDEAIAVIKSYLQEV